MRATLPALFLLSACAGAQGPWPSLALRPGETPRVVAEASEPAPAPALAIDPALEAALLKRAEAAQGALLTARAALDEALPRAAKAPAGSEAWAAAQQALSRFDAAAGGLVEVRTAAETALAEGRASQPLSALIDRLAQAESDNLITSTNAASALAR